MVSASRTWPSGIEKKSFTLVPGTTVSVRMLGVVEPESSAP